MIKSFENIQKWFSAGIPIMLSLLLMTGVRAQNKTIQRTEISAGNIQANGGAYKLNGTIGQNVIGLSQSNQNKISSGYWGWIARWASLGTDDEELIPKSFTIKPAYPNPFNPSTKIDMEIPDGGLVQITIYDLLGRIVLDHKKDYPGAGHYQFLWNARTVSGAQLATGTYIVTVRHKNKLNTQKITFLK